MGLPGHPPYSSWRAASGISICHRQSNRACDSWTWPCDYKGRKGHCHKRVTGMSQADMKRSRRHNSFQGKEIGEMSQVSQAFTHFTRIGDIKDE